LRLFSFGGYGLALAALALVVFGAYDSYPENPRLFPGLKCPCDITMPNYSRKWISKCHELWMIVRVFLSQWNFWHGYYHGH